MRREAKVLADSILSKMPRIEAIAMTRSINDTNHYFEVAFVRSEVEKARSRHDHDLLSVYSAYLERDLSYEAVWHTHAVLLSGFNPPVAGIIEDLHVIAAQRLLAAFRKHREYEMFKPYDQYRSVLDMVFQSPDLADRVTAIVAERDITDPSEIMELIHAGEQTSQPLSAGVL